MNTNASSSPFSSLPAHEHHHDQRNRFIIGAGIIIVLAVVIGGIYLIRAKRERAFNAYYDSVIAAQRQAIISGLAEADAKPLSAAQRAQATEALRVASQGATPPTAEEYARMSAELEAAEEARRDEIKQQYKDSK